MAPPAPRRRRRRGGGSCTRDSGAPAPLVAASLLALPPASSASPVVFEGLGDLPGDPFNSRAFGVSPDGRTIVGQGTTGSEFEAFRWTASAGLVGLGTLPGGVNSSARSVATDGAAIVGLARVGNDTRAFRWTPLGGMGSLGTIGNGTAVVAMGVSADGATAAGFFVRDVAGGGFRWTSFGGLQALDDLPAEEPYSEAKAISADGNVIVGFSLDGDGRVQATRWATNTPQPLGFLPGSTKSEAFGVSADGSVVVGISGPGGAFRWTAADGMTGIGGEEALGVSADGAIVVGVSGDEAAIWTQEDGMRPLATVLAEVYGIDVGGWWLRAATSISADGSVIAGWGTNPGGAIEAWRVPEPAGGAAGAAAGLALAGLAARVRRRHSSVSLALGLALLTAAPAAAQTSACANPSPCSLAEPTPEYSACLGVAYSPFDDTVDLGQQVGFGLASVSAERPRGGAQARASAGYLALTADANIVRSDEEVPFTTNSFAAARWRSPMQIDSPGRQGFPGTLVGIFAWTGNRSASAGPITRPDLQGAVGNTSLAVLQFSEGIESCGDGALDSESGCTGVGLYANGCAGPSDVDYVLTVTWEYTFGEPFFIGAEALVAAAVVNPVPSDADEFFGNARSDFFGTGRWMGIEEVRDSSGVPIADYTVVDLSGEGIDWTKPAPVPVPEPGPSGGSLAAACTLAAIGALRRSSSAGPRRRRRRSSTTRPASTGSAGVSFALHVVRAGPSVTRPSPRWGIPLPPPAPIAHTALRASPGAAGRRRRRDARAHCGRDPGRAAPRALGRRRHLR